MASQYLHSFDQSSLALSHVIPAKPRMFQQKLAGVVSLLSSLSAAVEDLEVAQAPAINDDFDFYQEVEKFEVNLIKSALRLSNGSQAKAAKLLKLNPTTLSAKMKTLKMTRGIR